MSLIFGHIEIRQLAEGARARRLMCGVGVAHAFTDAPNPIQFGEQLLEALITIAFDHARIHLSLGLSKLRLDNVIESHCDGLATDLAAPLRFSSRDTQSECSRRPLPLRRSAFCNASTPHREQHGCDEIPGQDGSAG